MVIFFQHTGDVHRNGHYKGTTQQGWPKNLEHQFIFQIGTLNKQMSFVYFWQYLIALMLMGQSKMFQTNNSNPN